MFQSQRSRLAIDPNSHVSGHRLRWRRRFWLFLLLTLPVLLYLVFSAGPWVLHCAVHAVGCTSSAPPGERAVASRRSASSITAVVKRPIVDPVAVNPTPTLPITTPLFAPVVTLLPWSPSAADALPIELAPWLIDPGVAPAPLVLLPTVTPEPPPVTPTPLPTAVPVALEQPVQPAVELTGLRHYWQTWNNCGPATLAMNLSYYGGALDQSAIGAVLRTHEDDKNVKPEELVNFAQGQGFQAAIRVSGSADLLRRLVSNGIPVLIETWVVPEPDNGLGHYRLITGYDDAEEYWIAYDSLLAFGLINPAGDYRGVRVPYNEFDSLWSVFNRLYIVVYPDAQTPLVQSILGDNFAPPTTWQQALLQAQTATQQQPDDAFAWFSLGSTLAALADYPTAAAAFDRARQLGLPRRMDWYQYEPLQAYYRVGRYADMLTITDAVLAQTPSIEDIHYWRGQALAAQGQTDAARQSWQQALDLNPNFAPARTALDPP